MSFNPETLLVHFYIKVTMHLVDGHRHDRTVPFSRLHPFTILHSDHCYRISVNRVDIGDYVVRPADLDSLSNMG